MSGTDLPKLDGIPADTLDPTEPENQTKLEFCKIYQELNRLSSKLLEQQAAENDTSQILRAIEKVLINRDYLDEEASKLGICAEPVVRNGRTIDISFCSPKMDRPIRRSFHARVPVPPGAFHLPAPSAGDANQE